MRPGQALPAEAEARPLVPADWFGYDPQGCDVYARIVYGARASVTVGVCTTVGVDAARQPARHARRLLRRLVDALLSRLTDIFFGIPFLLGGMVFLSIVPEPHGLDRGRRVIVLLGWPQIARIARGAVITAKQPTTCRPPGPSAPSNARILLRHILPNALAPVIVVATIALGTLHRAEATLSFLGVGLKPPAVSWGIDISRRRRPDPQRPAHAAVPRAR